MMRFSDRLPMTIDPTLRAVLDALGESFEWPADEAGRLQGTPRLQSKVKGVSGWFQGLTIRSGFSLVLSDSEHKVAGRYQHRSGDCIKFHIKLDGKSLIGNGADGEAMVSADRLSYLVQPAFTTKTEKIAQDSHERSVTLICSREFFASMLPDGGSDLPDDFRKFVRGLNPRFTHREVPLPLHMRMAAQELLAQPSGPLGDLMIEARALELLCATIVQFGTKRSDQQGPGGRDRQRVHDLRAILGDENGRGYSLSQLSRMLAWNETQMMESFKKITGTTISNYRHQLRMDEALRRLRTSDDSITQIAFDTGYEHSSNFATAFRRTFGFSPRASRRGVNQADGSDGRF